MIAQRAALALAAVAATATAGLAETAKPDPRDLAAVQSCLKLPRGKAEGERCVGVVVDPCRKRPASQSTAGMNACADRELAVWDAMLNDTLQKLRGHLDEEQQTKLRDMQRAWIDARDKTCEFYWDYFQGTMASPMGSYCTVRETARRALFLKFFLDESEGR